MKKLLASLVGFASIIGVSFGVNLETLTQTTNQCDGGTFNNYFYGTKKYYLYDQWNSIGEGIVSSSSKIQIFNKDNKITIPDGWRWEATYSPSAGKNNVFFNYSQSYLNLNSLTPADANSPVAQIVYNVRRMYVGNNNTYTLSDPTLQRTSIGFLSNGAPNTKTVTVNSKFDTSTLKTDNECYNIYPRWCGDGITSPEYDETCDPKAPGYTPETCNPTTCQPQPATFKCDSISANPTPSATTTFLPNQQVTFTCNGTNVQQWKLIVKQNGSIIDTKGPQANNSFVVNFPNAGSYSAQCIAINSQGNPTETTSSQCELPLTITPAVPEKTYECKNIQITNKNLVVPGNIDFTCYGSGDGITSFRGEVRNTLTNQVVYNATANGTSQATFRATGLSAGNYQTVCYVNGAKGEKTSPACQDNTISITPPVNPLVCEKITVPTQKLPTNSSATITCQGTGDNISYYTLRVTGPGFDKTYTKNTNANSATFTTDVLGDGIYSAVCSVSNGTNTATSPSCTASNQIIVGPNAPTCQDLTVSKGTANPNETITFTCNGSGDISKIKNYVISVNGEVIGSGGAGQNSFSASKTFQKGGLYTSTCTVYDTSNNPYTSQACSNKNVDIAGFDLSIKKYVNQANQAGSKEDAQDGNPYQVEVNKPYTYKVVVKNEGTIATFGETKVVDSEIQAGIKITGLPTGEGWTCTNTETSFTCTSNATIAAGQTFPVINVPAVATVVSNNLRNLAYVTNPNEKTPLDYPTDGKNKDEANVRTIDSGFDIELKKYISYNGTLYDAEDVNSQNTDTSTNTTTPVQLSGIGTTFDYIIRTKNTGPQTTKDLTTITDRLNQNVEIVSIDSNGWTCNIDTDKKGFKCDITRNDISAGNFYPEIKVSAKVIAYGLARNSATVSNPNDKNPNNNTDEANSNTYDESFALKIKKYVDRVSTETDAETSQTAIQKNVGENFQYVIVVSNVGPNSTKDITTVSDSVSNGVEFTFENGYQTNGWTCNYTDNTKRNFKCTNSSVIPKGAEFGHIVVPAKVVAAGESYNLATVTNPKDGRDDNPAIVKTPSGGGGGGGSYECTTPPTTTPGQNGEVNVTCYASPGYIDSVEIDCGGYTLKNSQLNKSYNNATGTCKYTNANEVREASCKINGRTLKTSAGQECKVLAKGAEFAYPSCREIDPPSVKMGEVLPIWWQLSGNTADIENAKCDVMLLRDENDLTNLQQSINDGRVKIYENLDCNTNTLTSGTSSERKMFEDFFRSNNTFLEGYNEAMGNKGGSAFIDTSLYSNPGNRYGEYMVQLTKIKYDTTNPDGTKRQVVVDTKGTCQYNFALMSGYTIQIGSNIATSSPDLFKNFYRLRGDSVRIFSDEFLSKLSTFVQTNYAGNDITYLTNKFIQDKDALAKTSVSSTDAGTTVRKTQGQEIYVFDGNAKFPNSISRSITKPTTFIVKGTATIDGDMNGNIMLVARDKIYFKANEDKTLKIEGIYITKDFDSDKIMNTAGKDYWSNDGRLDVRGTLIGNLNNLQDLRRPNIKTSEFFTNGLDLQKNLINAASLRISTNSAIWNSLPPGANEMNDLIQKARR